MNTEKLYYTDGHEVMVTATALKVHNKVYRLAGIIRHNLSTLGPARAPGLIMMVAGLLIAFVGLLGYFPIGIVPSVEVAGKWATTNDYAIVLGAVILIAGLVSLIVTKKRYAVHICTATEEADVIVSNEREYISQIVDGLDRALVARVVETTDHFVQI